ncbi:MAG: 4Fe-4S dicluster domain-containing protein [Candidatus Hodarchaeota archaeon]
MIENTDFRNYVRRIEEDGNFIKHDAKACTGCGNCEKICPMNLWTINKEKAILATDYRKKCVECGSCWLVCKDGAVDFKYPAGGKGIVWEWG